MCDPFCLRLVATDGGTETYLVVADAATVEATAAPSRSASVADRVVDAPAEADGP